MERERGRETETDLHCTSLCCHMTTRHKCVCEWSIIDEKGPLLSQLQFDIRPHLPTEGACSLTIVLLG